MNKAFIIIGVLWLVIILGFIGVKELNLSSGTEVLLKTQPVDPRDLFRGDYVILTYEISRLDVPPSVAEGDTVYVPLDLVEGYGVSRAVQTTKPEGLFIKGEVESVYSSTARISYGIESYFVPEGEGLELERARGDDLEVRVAIDNSGNAIIKDVILRGEVYS